jgi:oligopeptidase B
MFAARRRASRRTGVKQIHLGDLMIPACGRRALQIIVLALALAQCAAWVSAEQLDPSAATPPVAAKRPKTFTVHGDTRVDNYFWLREKQNPEVISYLEAENAYTSAVMKRTEHLQEKLYQEMLGRIKQTDLAVPYRLGGWWYYTRTEKGKQYPIHCRKRGNLDAQEEVLLDLNELAAGKKFLHVGVTKVSDDGNWLAYTSDVTGFREYTLHVKDLASGKDLPDRASRVSGFFSVEWTADNATLFYVTEDAAKRPYRLYRHSLGAANDELVFEEKDELFRLAIHRSRDKKYLFARSQSSVTTEERYLASERPTAAWQTILPREQGHEYYADQRDGLFYIRTNKGAENFRLVTAPVAEPRPARWKELIAHRPDALLQNVALFARHAVLTEWESGLPKALVLDFARNKQHSIELREPAYAVQPDLNPEYDTNLFRYHYQSFVTPDSVYDYDMDAHRAKLLKRPEVLGGYDPSRYESERVTATASDGARIPVTLVYRKGLRRDGKAPLLLYGYGAYGASQPVTFQSQRLSLLDRGVVYALVHIRGGSEMGRAWHDQGKMMHKRNTFTDFIAAAEHLIAERYTSKDRLAIMGGSAGGLLIGAVLNLRPDLCRAAVLLVPFVDVINTMLDASLPLTVQEYLEWGNPNVAKEYEYMKSYCPYTNIAARDYPAILVMTSLNDSQVMYWEPAKYVAKMRATKADKNVLLLRTRMTGGHGGASGRYDALRDQAFVFAFLLNEFGIPE